MNPTLLVGGLGRAHPGSVGVEPLLDDIVNVIHPALSLPFAAGLSDLFVKDAEQPSAHMGSSLELFRLLDKSQERGLGYILSTLRFQTGAPGGTKDLA